MKPPLSNPTTNAIPADSLADDPLRSPSVGGGGAGASSFNSPSSTSTRRPSIQSPPRRPSKGSAGFGGVAALQPLIRFDGDDDDDDKRQPARSRNTDAMTSDQSYGALDGRSREPTDNSEAASARVGGGGYPRPRQLSFKKRGGTGEGAASGSSGGGILNRASIAAFGRPFSSSSSNATTTAAGGQREARRVHTISVNGQPQRNDRATAEDDDGGASSWERKPRIPSLMPASPSNNSTPIPTVPFVVLCLVCFGEFSSAGVAGPFLFFQIETFNVGGESEVGYWAGVVASVFFFAQFLTSMLWASAAQSHGRRAVLLVSLLGNSLSLVAFGMSTNLKMAISVRLAQGLFNGAVGVAKGAVRDLTDSTNEGRAMATLGFAWGMGGIVGPLMGGLLCNPATKFPSLFGENEFLIKYPYVLPCLIVSTFTALGSFLTLFIGPDGGPRTGAIHLPEKNDVERVANRTTSAMGSFGRTAGKRISGYFGASSIGPDGQPRTPAGESLVDLRATGEHAEGNEGLPRTFTQIVDEETGGPPSPRASDVEDYDEDANGTAITTRAGTSAFDDGLRRPYFARPRRMSRTTARHRSILGGGSAYGYDAQLNASALRVGSVANNRASMAQHPFNRMSIMSSNQYAPDFEELGQARFSAKPRQLSFAQRFLLANDDAVLGLSDLWVAAAINNDEGFVDDEAQDDFGYDYGEDEEGDGRILEDETETLEESMDDSVFDRSDARDSVVSVAFGLDEPDEQSPLVPRHLPPLNFARRHRNNSAGASSRGGRPMMQRIGSNGRIPSVYSNTGVENTPMLSATANLADRPVSPAQGRSENVGGYDPTLAGIPESGSTPGTLRGASGKMPTNVNDEHDQYGGVNSSQITAQLQLAEKQSKSIFLQLPLGFIAHYGLMSLHSSTFDQIFMAYLVTPFKSGGLGLTAAHYAELIAAMAFCQIGLQFYFYPKVGPPQGKFSHLAMMRLGTCLYLPVYVLFSYLRAFLHPSTDALVMSFMILFASLRFLANTCAFTSVAILMNATTEPHLVPLANGLAQTTSSAARFIGPLLGGMLWAKGIEGGYEIHSWPFNYQMGFWLVGLFGFTGFLHTWLIR